MAFVGHVKRPPNSSPLYRGGEGAWKDANTPNSSPVARCPPFVSFPDRASRRLGFRSAASETTTPKHYHLGCVEDARAFCQPFFGWYNDEHHHSALGSHASDRALRTGRCDSRATRRRSRRGYELAVHSARAEAVQYQVTPETTAAFAASGYPVMWAVTGRARSASWILRHRQVLERALA